ncbi:MAG: transporter [Actinomycetia bacterium]|nr:transporter [Actinomycetes bacterium]
MTAIGSRSSPFTALLAARALSLVGDGVGTLALVVYVQRSVGTGKAIGLLLLFEALPSLLSPISGVVSDRFDRRLVIAACEVAQGLLTVLILAWLPTLPLLLTLVGLKSTAARIADPATRSAVPSLVPDEGLVRANAWYGALREGAQVLGPLLGGVLVAIAGVRAGLAADAATFFISVPLLLRLPSLRPDATGEEEREGFATQVREGVRYIVRHPVARAVALGFFFIGFTGADDVAMPFLARHFGAGSAGLGTLYAATALGLVLGYLVILRLIRPIAPAAGFVAGCAVVGIGNGLTGIAPAIAVAVGFQLVRGVGIAVLETNLQTMLQRTVEPSMLGRVFANVYGAVSIAGALSVSLGGVLLDATSPRVVLLTVGALGLAASAASGVLLRRVKP